MSHPATPSPRAHSAVTSRTRREARTARESSFRPDIQLLRALAVLAVVVYHLWPAHLPGGYVGVDVFFVISGFLITSHLLREVATTGRIRLGMFWARRARRLLPAALLVLLVTAVAAILILPATVLRQTLTEIVAAVFYVQNWMLAVSSVDYLALDNIASPVQHFWTLSVEEQFYILLPLVMLVTAAVARRTGRSTVRAVVAVLIAMTAASFAYSVWLTEWSQPTAYFSTATRLWEFGLGGLIGAAPALRSARWRPWLVSIGLVGILITLVAFGPGTPFPGSLALLPVVSTALVLWAGTGSYAARIGRNPAVAFVGRISYAVYLWHWPPIVLLPYLTGHPLTLLEGVAILAVTLIVAGVSTRWWEDRIRFSPRLLGGARPRVVALVLASAMVCVAAVPASAVVLGERAAAERRAATEAAAASLADCLGAASRVDASCESVEASDVLLPAPEDAPADLEARDECWSNGSDSELRVCTIGPETGYEKRILVVGDSHAKALLAALEVIAADEDWRIDLASRASCYWTTHDLLQKSQELTDACTDWRANLAAHLAEDTDLDAIVAVKGRRELADETVITDPERALETVADGMAQAWDSRPDHDVPVIALVDNPRLPASTVDCVVRHRADAAAECAYPTSRAFPADGVVEAAARAENVTVVDLTPLYCDDELCPPVIGNVVVYRDGRHITDTYARTVAPYLAEEIAAAAR